MMIMMMMMMVMIARGDEFRAIVEAIELHIEDALLWKKYFKFMNFLFSKDLDLILLVTCERLLLTNSAK